MTLKGQGPGPLPPLLQQYVEVRDKYPEYLLLFQVGDFYETFGEDAERLARALGLVLTHKPSKDFTTPMAGLPIRVADAHLERLLRLGFRVAVADQVEHPDEADGLVKREVTQLLTPGTITQESLLRPEANYLAALATGDGYGLAVLDVSTGEFRGVLLYGKNSVYDELFRYRPAEVLLAPELTGNPEFLGEFQRRFSLRSSLYFTVLTVYLIPDNVYYAPRRRGIEWAVGCGPKVKSDPPRIVERGAANHTAQCPLSP